jgi:thioredoxin 1
LRRCNLIVVILVFLFVGACQDGTGKSRRAQHLDQQAAPKGVVIADNRELDFSQFKVTLLEIGANACIPCRKMQPIIKEIAEQFPDDVQVVFFDVWKDPTPANKYGVRLIPTQVFLDKNGQEFSRHVGFFPKEEILKVLEKKGVK